MDDRVKCLTPWDVESTRIFNSDGAFMSLYAKQGGGGGYVIISLQGGGRTSQNSKGSGYGEDVMFTLNVIDVHGVCYGLSKSLLNSSSGSNGGIPIGENIQPSIVASSHGGGAVCYTVDCRNLCLNDEKSATLQSKNQGGHSLNYTNPVLIEKKGKYEQTELPNTLGCAKQTDIQH